MKIRAYIIVIPLVIFLCWHLAATNTIWVALSTVSARDITYTDPTLRLRLGLERLSIDSLFGALITSQRIFLSSTF